MSTAEQQRAYRRRHGIGPRVLAEHGTRAAYRRHIRNPTKWGPPCGPCTDANTRSVAEYRASRKMWQTSPAAD